MLMCKFVYIEKIPQSVDTERGNGGRPQAVSSGASPAPELPLWSKLRKYRPRIDIRRRYGYNTYRVRPKRSAVLKVLFPYGNYRSGVSRAVIFF